MAFDLAQLVANIIPKKKDGATFPAMGVINPTVEPFNKIENVNTQGIGPVPLGGADPNKYILPVTPPMMEQFPGSGRPEMAATPAPQNPLDILNQQRQGILDKDYSIKKDDLGNITHRGVDRDTDHNWWDVVKSIGAGIGRTALQANAQGRQMELGEFLGSALGGGIGGGVNRNYDEQFVDEVKLQGLDQKIGRQMAQDSEKAKQDLLKAQVDRTKADTLDTLTKPAREKAEQQARIDLERMKEEAEGKKWKPTTRNGKYYKQYNDGREEPLLDAEGKQEVELREVPVKTIVDGQEVWTIGDKVIDRKIAEEYRQAQMTMDADKYNATEINNYTESLDKWASDAQQAQNKITQLKADGQGKLTEADQLESQANAIQETDEFGEVIPATGAAKRALQAKAAELRREGASLHRQASEYKLPPKPTKPKATLSAPKLGAKTVTEAEIDAIVQKTGKTKAEVRALAKRDGYVIK